MSVRPGNAAWVIALSATGALACAADGPLQSSESEHTSIARQAVGFGTTDSETTASASSRRSRR